MINEIRREFSIVPDFSMFVDFNHDRFRIAIVALRPVFAVGNAAFDFWHMITPCPQLARCKEGVFLPNWFIYRIESGRVDGTAPNTCRATIIMASPEGPIC